MIAIYQKFHECEPAAEPSHDRPSQVSKTAKRRIRQVSSDGALHRIRPTFSDKHPLCKTSSPQSACTDSAVLPRRVQESYCSK